MKTTLIQLLETICPNNVFLQGTLAPDAAYPDSFITFWTNYTSDRSNYDNKVKSIDWEFSVMYYTSDPSNMSTIPALILSTLQAAGFKPQGKGSDLLSDEPTHTGWVIDFVKTEYISTN